MEENSADKTVENRDGGSPASSGESAPNTSTDPAEAARPKEIGGRKGLDPVRYGDWEKDGRCIDF